MKYYIKISSKADDIENIGKVIIKPSKNKEILNYKDLSSARFFTSKKETNKYLSSKKFKNSKYYKFIKNRNKNMPSFYKKHISVISISEEDFKKYMDIRNYKFKEKKPLELSNKQKKAISKVLLSNGIYGTIILI